MFAAFADVRSASGNSMLPMPTGLPRQHQQALRFNEELLRGRGIRAGEPHCARRPQTDCYDYVAEDSQIDMVEDADASLVFVRDELIGKPARRRVVQAYVLIARGLRATRAWIVVPSRG
jgi:hypothetical protein